jgi:glycosyltransferase involved in cell wall biosynthesis
MMQPLVSVLLPVFNAAEFLEPALTSIFRQSYSNLEILAIDDGSTDESVSVLERFTDSRLRIVRNEQNRGICMTLNRAIDLAGGDYLARMDADDICHRDRIRTQMAFLESNRQVGICGTAMRRFGRGMPSIWRGPTTDEEIRCLLFFESPMAHPTVLFRADIFRHGLRYDPDMRHAEDYDLWERASHFTRLANLPAVLYRYRVHVSNTLSQPSNRVRETTERVRRRLLSYLYPAPSDEELRLHRLLLGHEEIEALNDLEAVSQWCTVLIQANESRKSYAQMCFRREIARRLFYACTRAGRCVSPAFDVYRAFPYCRQFHPGFVRSIKHRLVLPLARSVQPRDG